MKNLIKKLRSVIKEKKPIEDRKHEKNGKIKIKNNIINIL